MATDRRAHAFRRRAVGDRRRVAALGVAVRLLAGLAAWALFGQTIASTAPDVRGSIAAVEAVGLTVDDMERSLAFYTTVLPFEVVSDHELADEAFDRLKGVFGARVRIVRLALGDEIIELTDYLTASGRPIPIDSRSQDRWFQHVAIIVRDMDRAYARLRQHRVTHVSPGPQRLPDWNPNAGGIEAFYFMDPDGHPLELLAFPDGKGNPKWHRPTDRIFLGIDHTAIVVGDTEASLRFYRDTLGLRVAGESENHGPEQERLNSVFGARLRITGLAAPAGPGVELLDYLAPGGGRPRPADARANDLIHWETTLAASGIERVAGAIRMHLFGFTSPGIVQVDTPSAGFDRAMLVRDPDGHAVRIVERQP